MQQKV